MLEKEVLYFQADSRGILGCVANVDELRALAEAELKYICALIPADRREAYFNVPEVESALPALL